MQVAEFITEDELVIAVAVEVTESRSDTFDAEVRERQPIGVELCEGRCGGRSHIAEPRQQCGGIAGAVVALLAGDHKVGEPVGVKVGEGGVGAAAQLDHVLLQKGGGLQIPHRGFIGSRIAVPPDALLAVEFEDDVGGQQQVGVAILVRVDREGGGKPLEVERHPTEVGRPDVGGGHGAVLSVDRIDHVACRQVVVGDVAEQQVEVAIPVEFD